MANVIEDKVLGQLTWDEEHHWWAGNVEVVPNYEYQILIQTEAEDEELEEVLERARALTTRLKRETEFRPVVAEQMLDLYNDEWREETDAAIDHATFINTIRLDFVSLFEDGSGELYYNDGGLFAEHAIGLDVDADGNVGEAFLAG